MDRRSCYYLKRVFDDVEQKEFIPLKGDEVVLGRRELPGEHISRSHAKFRRTGEKWTVTNLGRNGVFVDGDALDDGKEYPVSAGSVIQFGQPDVYVYKLKVKHIDSDPENISKLYKSTKKARQDNERCHVETNLSQEQADLEKQLRESDALQARLQEERQLLLESVQRQHEELKQKYNLEREQLELKFANGALAQQVLLDEKETLARNLETQVCELQTRLDEEKKSLEERLMREVQQRNHILQEKENVVRRLEEENARRAQLEEQLKTTESLKEELQQKVEAIESEARVKGAKLQEINRKQDELVTEKARLMQELETVKSRLMERESTSAQLDSELKEKEELKRKLAVVDMEMKTKVDEEVKKSALKYEETNRKLEQIIREKNKLEEQLQATKEQDQEHRDRQEERVQTLEAQKLSLEQELASYEVMSDHAKQEVVENVSNVLENEFQCPICNDLFITAVMLNCSHTFCRYCLDQWKKKKKDCPNCRCPIVSETRSLVIDNFIEKIVPTLSEELQKRRAEIVDERKAEMEAAALAKAQAEAARAAARTNRRGRGRGRGRGRESGPGNPVPVTAPVTRPPGSSAVTTVVISGRGYMLQGNPNVIRVLQQFPNSVSPMIHGVAGSATVANGRNLPPAGSATNPIYVVDHNSGTAGRGST